MRTKHLGLSAPAPVSWPRQNTNDLRLTHLTTLVLPDDHDLVCGAVPGLYTVAYRSRANRASQRSRGVLIISQRHRLEWYRYAFQEFWIPCFPTSCRSCYRHFLVFYCPEMQTRWNPALNRQRFQILLLWGELWKFGMKNGACLVKYGRVFHSMGRWKLYQQIRRFCGVSLFFSHVFGNFVITGHVERDAGRLAS